MLASKLAKKEGKLDAALIPCAAQSSVVNYCVVEAGTNTVVCMKHRHQHGLHPETCLDDIVQSTLVYVRANRFTVVV